MQPPNPSAEVDGKWLTATQVAERFQVSTWTIRNLHRVGRLRGTIIARKLRFSPKAVAAFEAALEGT